MDGDNNPGLYAAQSADPRAGSPQAKLSRCLIGWGQQIPRWSQLRRSTLAHQSPQRAAHAGSSREFVIFRVRDPSTSDSRRQGPPQRTKTSQRSVGWGQQIPGSSQLCRATPAPHAVPRRQDSRTKWLQDDIGRVALLKRLAANLVESSRLGSRHRHSCPSCRWHKGFGRTGQRIVALPLNGRSSRRPLLSATMENFRIRSCRSLVWWGRAPQMYSMHEAFGVVPLTRTLALWR